MHATKRFHGSYVISHAGRHAFLENISGIGWVPIAIGRKDGTGELEPRLLGQFPSRADAERALYNDFSQIPITDKTVPEHWLTDPDVYTRVMRKLGFQK